MKQKSTLKPKAVKKPIKTTQAVKKPIKTSQAVKNPIKTQKKEIYFILKKH